MIGSTLCDRRPGRGQSQGCCRIRSAGRDVSPVVRDIISLLNDANRTTERRRKWKTVVRFWLVRFWLVCFWLVWFWRAERADGERDRHAVVLGGRAVQEGLLRAGATREGGRGLLSRPRHILRSD